jgi:hypothetical protein
MPDPTPTDGDYQSGWNDCAEDIANDLDALAEKIRSEAFTPSVGIALASIVEQCRDVAAKHVNTTGATP